MTDWILYRKGSFSLKERVASEALFGKRKEILEHGGASYVRLVRENNPWLRQALELPAMAQSR